MNGRHHYLRRLAQILGVVGLLVCVLSVVATWFVAARLRHTTNRLYATVDESLTAVEAKVSRTQASVETLRLKASDLKEGLTQWTQSEVSERIVTNLELDRRAETIAFGLDRASEWLEAAETSVQTIERVVDLGNSAGLSIETDRLGKLRSEIEATRRTLESATEPVNTLRDRTINAGERALADTDVESLLQLTVRIVATVTDVDSRLGQFASRITDARDAVQASRAVPLRWIRLSSLGVMLILAWMGAGQGALIAWGKKRLSAGTR